ncbi:MAG: FAD-binding protein [Erysipelotrichaceae bacterium]|nr:FAD-binding protein [Erysipelotrichaceae bacterium]MDY5251535.1 FAD-binding protein [Erysipelotrichaceae bacterium]
MNKVVKASLASALCLSLAACSTSSQPNTTPAASSASTQEGVYEAVANGYGGELKVKVTINEGNITNVELGENHETNVVIDRAFPVIAERIVNANSPVVDSVTGATFSSYAVKAAVADAMSQAGLEAPEITMATAGEEKAPSEIEAVECDIVVVGGGPSGLAAAISAKQTNPDANVIVIEKLDILSGNGKFDMNFFDLINSEAQKAAGNEKYTVNQVENFKADKAESGETPERIDVWANEANELDAWLRNMGVELNYSYTGTSHLAEADQYAGEVIQAGLEKTALELGVEIRTGTKGNDLVMNDGTCTGVTVTNNDNESYTINADAIIVATGGFCANKELLAEYAPGHEALNTSNQMGATGDFVKVFEENGFMMANMGKMSVFSNIIVPRRDLTGGADMNLLVNKEGALLNDNISGLDRGTMIQEQTDGAAFYITDKTGYDSFYRIRKHVGLGYYSQGETVEELATALGIDPEGLKASVEQYNADAQAQSENAILEEVPSRPLDAEGPYYGVQVEAANHMTKGGVVANEKAEVLYEDGSVVPGLYAAGEVTAQSGGYAQSVVFGKVAGQNAAANLK